MQVALIFNRLFIVNVLYNNWLAKIKYKQLTICEQYVNASNFFYIDISIDLLGKII